MLYSLGVFFFINTMPGCTHPHREHKDSSASEHRPSCHFVSETRSNISVYTFVYARVRVQNAGTEGSRWTSIVLQISCQSTSRWPVGDARGLSGRCERFESFVGAPCLLLSKKKKKAKLRFWTIAEASGLLLNSHSSSTWTHNDAVFKLRYLYCCPLTSAVEPVESWITPWWFLEEALNWVFDFSLLRVM